MTGLTASAAGLAPVKPPRSWFADPRLDGPTSLTVTDEGRVFGHAASFGTCHLGFADCIQPPRSKASYRHFLLGEITTAEGDRVHVGQITLGTTHAPLSLKAVGAQDHYEHTGLAVADVTVGEDQHGIWLAGALRPNVPVARVRELTAAKISGDWRKLAGNFELVGLLAVNVPGFPVQRTQARLVASAENVDSFEMYSLVASGIVGGSRRGVLRVSANVDASDYARKMRSLAGPKKTRQRRTK